MFVTFQIAEETKEVRELIEEIAEVARKEEEQNFRLRCTKVGESSGTFPILLTQPLFRR